MSEESYPAKVAKYMQKSNKYQSRLEINKKQCEGQKNGRRTKSGHGANNFGDESGNEK